MGELNDYKVYFPERRVFVSGKHNWAFAAWEMFKQLGYTKANATLCHVDAHLDDVWDGLWANGLYEMKDKKDVYKVASNLLIDNFIWPSYAIDTIDEIIFVTRTNTPYSEHNPFDLYDTKRRDDINKFLLTDAEKIISKKPLKGERLEKIEQLKNSKVIDDIDKKKSSMILDLDLDYFNLSNLNNVSDLMKDQDIKEKLIYLRDLCNWDIITVSLSPFYCGGDENCWHIYEIFLEVFDLDLSNTEIW